MISSLLREIFTTTKDVVELVESLGTKEFLLELTIPDLEKQWVDQGKIKKYQFDDVKDYLGDLGANYMAWFLARCFTDKLIDFDDLDIWADRLKVFKNNNNNKEISIKDLGKVQSKADIDRLESDVARVNLQRYGKDQNAEAGGKSRDVNLKPEDLYIGTCETDRDTFKVYKLPKGRTDLYSLSRKLGAGARWCTASSTNSYFNEYIALGPLYILIGTKIFNKFQYFPGGGSKSYEFKGITDNEIDYRKEWVRQFFEWLVEKGELSEVPVTSRTGGMEAGDREVNPARLEASLTRLIEADLEIRQKVEGHFRSNEVKEEVGTVYFVDRHYLQNLGEQGGFEALEDRWNLGEQGRENLRLVWNSAQEFGGNANTFVFSDGAPLVPICLSLDYSLIPIESLSGGSIIEQIEQAPNFSRKFLTLLQGNVPDNVISVFSGAFKQDREAFFEKHPWQHIENTKLDYIVVPYEEGDMDVFRRILSEYIEDRIGKYGDVYLRRTSTLVRLAPGVYVFTSGNPSPVSGENPKRKPVLQADIRARWRFSKGCPESLYKRPLEFYNTIWKPIYKEALGFRDEDLNFLELDTVSKYGNKRQATLQRYIITLTSERTKDKDKVSEALSKVVFLRIPENRRDLARLLGTVQDAPSSGILILPINYADKLRQGGYPTGVFISTLNHRVSDKGNWDVFDVYTIRNRYFAKLDKTAFTGLGYLEAIYGGGTSGGSTIWRAVSEYLGAFVQEDNSVDSAKAFGIYRKKDVEQQEKQPQEAPQQQEPRQRRQRQATEQPQQEPAQNNTNGENRQGRAMTIRWSTIRVDNLTSGVEITFEEALEKMQRGSRSVAEKVGILRNKKEQEERTEGTTIRAFEDESNGKIYIYFLRGGHTIVHYASGGKIIDVEHTVNTNLNESQFKVIFQEKEVKPNSLLSFLVSA